MIFIRGFNIIDYVLYIRRFHKYNISACLKGIELLKNLLKRIKI